MIVIVARLTAKEEHTERFLKLLEADVEGSLGEEGCLQFEVSRDEADTRVHYLYEVYRDSAAYAAHREADHFKSFLEEAANLLAEPPEVRIAGAVFPRDAARWAKR